MRRKLEDLGLRQKLDGKFTLKCGITSDVFWNIEKLFEYPEWVRLKAIEEFIWEIGKVKPKQTMGIPTGGQLLARDVADALGTLSRAWEAPIMERPCVLIDDVLTTGGTIRRAMNNVTVAYGKKLKPDYIAVLVNRSGLDEIEGIPIISGIKTDRVI